MHEMFAMDKPADQSNHFRRQGKAHEAQQVQLNASFALHENSDW